MRIAFIGQRGVPATYGGVERHVEEIGARLAARGHDVTVYTRSNYAATPVDRYRGMRVRTLPTVGAKHLDAIVHSTLSTFDAVARGVDIVHYHAVGPGILAVVPRYLSRAKVVLTVHGLDADRAKWGRGATAALEGAQWMSAHVPDTTIVVSKELQRVYRERYGRSTAYIPNGVDAKERRAPAEIADRFGLPGDGYFLFVGRLVPEKAPDLLLRAFARVPGEVRLVVVGGSSFTDDYVATLRRLAEQDPRVLLPGYVYGETLEELYTNAAAFVLPSSVEGLPLTLLEAASYGTPVIVSDIAPNIEVVGADGPGHRIVPCGDESALTHTLAEALADREADRSGGAALRERVLATYSWDDAARATEDVYRSIR